MARQRGNPSLHKPDLSPSELSSRIRGLQTRYDMNAQLIKWWKTHRETGRLLHHEYQLSRAYPECCELLYKEGQWAANQIRELTDVQTALQRELDRLRGQLRLPTLEDEILGNND